VKIQGLYFNPPRNLNTSVDSIVIADALGSTQIAELLDMAGFATGSLSVGVFDVSMKKKEVGAVF